VIAEYILYRTLIGKRCINETGSKSCLLCARLDDVTLPNALFTSMLRITQSEIKFLHALIATLPTCQCKCA
jgi:hypothetical protein